MSDVQIAVVDQQDTQIVLAVPGVQGATGSEIPTGGTADQVLRKSSSTNYDTNWSQVTSAMIADGTIVNADINASAAIAGTKISPDFGSQNVTTTGTSTAASFIPTSSTVPSNGVYLPAANSVALSTNGTGKLFIDTNGNVTLTGAGTGTRYLALLNETSTYAGSYVLQAGGGSAGFGGAITMYGHSHATYPGSVYIGTSAGSGGSIILGTNNALDPANEKLRITSAGLVGVGTSSPGGQLTVYSAGNQVRVESPAASNADILFRENGVTNWTAGYVPFISAFRFSNGSSDILTLTNTGNVGVGTTSPAHALTVNSGSILISNRGSGNSYLLPDWRIYNSSSGNALVFDNYTTEAFRVDSSNRLLVGTSSARTVGEIVGGATYTAQANLQLESPNNSLGISLITNRSADATGPFITLGKSRGNALGGVTVVQNGDELGNIYFAGADGTDIECIGAAIFAEVDGTPGANDMPGRLVFSTTADGASSPTERMRINSSGSVRIGGTGDPGAIHVIQQPGIAIGTQVLSIQGSQDSVRVYDASDFANPNGATTVLWVRANNSTSRSINAAGTVNASGADYAEYMNKAGDFVIAKGDICGINSGGNLTAIFDEAIGFLVKSTNPSYVGGDTWGAGFDGDPDGLEAARQKVDRIAFAGQVPVNVMGASPGQYIVPVKAANGGIEGVAKNEADLTLAEYMRAVGKVIAIEDDGRARIIVKVA